MRAMERRVTGILYYIRVKGSLDKKWSDWFDGFTLLPYGSDETLLIGSVADQAALHGILVKINNLGIPLTLVAQIDCSYAGTPCPVCGHSMDVITNDQCSPNTGV
jgi:hypothetical protein